jgi:lipoate-protein ligase A
MGAVPAARFVRDGVKELYDYDELRQIGDATVFVARVEVTTLVLGGSQSVDVLGPAARSVAVRRRRGGGGLVLLRPDDLWVDWWLPRDDSRWSPDVHVSSERVGQRWAQALRAVSDSDIVVHSGPLEGDPAQRVACFAGRGPGEVFVDGRKAVGVTQWRVREGVFVSSVLHAAPTSDVVDFLANAPEGLGAALDHAALANLHIEDREGFELGLVALEGPWRRRTLLVSD